MSRAQMEERDRVIAKLRKLAPGLSNPALSGGLGQLLAEAADMLAAPADTAVRQEPVAWYQPLGTHALCRWGNRRPDEGDINAWKPLYAAAPADTAPIPMILFCPWCLKQHIDQPQPEKNWNNPPHRSHECQGCGYVWRPADIPTIGVSAIKTRGKNDDRPADTAVRDAELAATALPWGVLQDDLAALLRALCMFDGAQPKSPHEVMREAIAAVTSLQHQLDAVTANAERMRTAIDEHNKDCATSCGEGDQEGVRCKYRPYFPRHRIVAAMELPQVFRPSVLDLSVRAIG